MSRITRELIKKAHFLAFHECEVCSGSGDTGTEAGGKCSGCGGRGVQVIEVPLDDLITEIHSMIYSAIQH